MNNRLQRLQRMQKEIEFFNSMPGEKATHEERWEFAKNMVEQLPWLAKEYDGMITIYMHDCIYKLTPNSTTFVFIDG